MQSRAAYNDMPAMFPRVGADQLTAVRSVQTKVCPASDSCADQADTWGTWLQFGVMRPVMNQENVGSGVDGFVEYN